MNCDKRELSHNNPFFNNTQICINMLKHRIEINSFDIPIIIESTKNSALIKNTEEILQQNDLEQISLLEQKLKNISQ